MNIFIDTLDELPSFKSMINFISSEKSEKSPILVNGVIDSQKAHLSYAVYELTKRPMLIIAPSPLKAKSIYEDMQFFIKDKVVLYPSKDIIFYSADIKSADIIKTRFEIIDRLLKGDNICIVLSVEALFDRLVPKNIFKDFILDLSAGDEIAINKLSQKLIYMGYERSDMVEGRGQFAVRGGIVDIFDMIGENAVRIEFWDDEIDTIRSFDTISQRSVERLDKVKIFPVREIVYDEIRLKRAETLVKSEFEKCVSLEEYKDNIKELYDDIMEKFKQQKVFSGADKYIQFLYEDSVSFFDYLSNDTIVFFDEPSRINEYAKNTLDEFADSINNRILKGTMFPSQVNMIFRYDYIIKKSEEFETILFSSVIKNIKDFKVNKIVDFSVKSSSVFKNNFDMLINDIKHMIKSGYRILFLAGGHTRCERIVKELIERDIPAFFIEDIKRLDAAKNVVYVLRGSLNSGFEYIENKFSVIADKEIFGNGDKKKNLSKKKKKKSVLSFNELKLGDYVVHESHGIGVYQGVEKINSQGVIKDYIKIGYAGGGTLYVAINQMDFVQKYIGGESSTPKLNKLGTGQWEKSKAKAKKAAYIQAEELVELYAKRRSNKGFSYSKDSIWQREFEDSFIYDETEDQLNAVKDIKDDMESGKIMDRLICGDVGFGKTEVAIRAAFKAVQDSKQVAYLVPTTILAQQHYTTFISRMQNFAVNVEMLSRFKTQKQQKEVIKGLSNGMVDIVIGTHRILSKDIVFKDLGLIIVDEEQRFGVSHKEKMKKIKSTVNVLTLSATPIPRTLHMSLSGIRDMSVLEQPPNERLPIQTYVMEFSPEAVRDAIHREIARGGQVYYLYNRVRNIEEVMIKIKKLVPEANVGYAHGQMSERELENVMVEFMENNINVLVCTTIIETGLDIPNVNTIIIQDADCMGLSQLYQLRGRVGRSNRSSFAYLMYKKDKALKEVSEKRLQTIREFTEFGSGFKVAMRDLEIRGAGNILGAEQHGHMDIVGYELYCKLLDEAVKELTGIKVQERFETVIDINIDAFISSDYISNEEQKLDMYKKIAAINCVEDYFDVQDELEDRYGDIPLAVGNLLEAALLKAFAHSIGIESIKQKGNNIVLLFRDKNNIDSKSLIKAVVNNSLSDKMLISGGNKVYITYRIEEGNNKFLIDLKNSVEKIKAVIDNDKKLVES